MVFKQRILQAFANHGLQGLVFKHALFYTVASLLVDVEGVLKGGGNADTGE